MALAWIGAIGWPVALLLGWRQRRRAVRADRTERRRQGWSRQWRRPARVLVLALLSVVWALGVWAFLIEPETLVVRAVTVESAAWRGPPLRIGLIADTHVGAPHMNAARMQRVVARMNALHPDIVVLLGDYVGGHAPIAARAARQRADVMAGLAAFARLQAPLGAVGVFGNHDWYFSGDDVERGFIAAGAPLLENQTIRIAREEGAFWVTGLADPVSHRQPPSYADAMGAIDDDAPIIAISHRPDAFEYTPANVAITLAGHSHCGQVNLPVFGRLFAASAGSARWPCGAYDDRGRKLYVTGGVGVSLVPARFRQPPEIVMLTLVAKPQ